jgi:STE24 endopeptidase
VAFLLAFIAVVGFVGLPIQNVVSRNIEARADLNALNLTSNAQTFAEMQRRLAITAKADVTPNPLLFTWFGSHPSTAQRLAMARGWAAEHGEPVPAPLADSDTNS